MLLRINFNCQGYQQIQAYGKTTAKKCFTKTNQSAINKRLKRSLRFKFFKRILFNAQSNLEWTLARLKTLFKHWKK